MDMGVAAHTPRTRVWLDFRTIVPIIQGRLDSCWTHMVAPTLPMKPGLGEWEGELKHNFPEEGRPPKMCTVVSNDFEINDNVYPTYSQNDSMKLILTIFMGVYTLHGLVPNHNDVLQVPVTILQTRTLVCREVTWFAQGHTAGRL